MRQQRRRRRHLLSKQRCILMPLWCSRCDSAYTNCYFFSALLPCSLFQCASLFVSVLPTLSCLFAHFCFGRMRVADGVSIDLSKWDNKQPRECNEQKQKRLPRKQTQHGRRTTKQTVAKAAPAHHALLQNNMYCPFICPSILFFTRVHAKRFKAATCARAPPPSRHPDHRQQLLCGHDGSEQTRKQGWGRAEIRRQAH